MLIKTKNIESVWHSYTTFKGTDFSESGKTIEEAQGKIRCRLETIGVEFEDMKWDKPQVNFYIQEPKQKFAPIGYATSRIDNNPIA